MVMASFIASTAAVLIIFFVDTRPKWKTQSKKMFWLSVVFLFSGYVLLALVSFEIRPPSPLLIFEKAVGVFTGK